MDTYTERWGLLHTVQISSRYHARRQAFFERWGRVTSGIGVIFASSALADLVRDGGHAVAIASAMLVTVASTVDLVVGTSSMSVQHRDLRRRYLDLEATIRQSDNEPPKADVDTWTQERFAIEADEPPKYTALALLVENELSRAEGRQGYDHLTPWERLTAHWCRWEDLPPKAAARPKSKPDKAEASA